MCHPKKRLSFKIIRALFNEAGSNNNMDNKRKHSGSLYCSCIISRPGRRTKQVFMYKETFGICNIINTLRHG